MSLGGGMLAAVADETHFASFLRAVECAGDREGILGSDRLVFPPSPDFRYAATPLNAVTSADMRCDGVHYAILASNGAITDESPVIHVSPLDTGEPYAVLGTSFLDYLAVACDVPASELEGVFMRERSEGNTLVPFLRARFSHSRLYDDARFERLASHLAYIEPKPIDED